jgi:uncharacterized Tic20 family protein
MNYNDLKTLDELRRSGAITEEEYQKEKQKFFDRQTGNASSNPLLGMTENSYIALMHISQLSGYILPFLGFIAPVILWIMNKDSNDKVDATGKHILNFIFSWFIYVCGAAILCLLLIGIPLLIALSIAQIVFAIIAAIKANNGESWKYPFTIDFLK